MPDSVRLDIWLDVACLAKTRSQAKLLCEGGKVDVDGDRAKPHRALKAGDRIRITLGPGHRREVVVRELAETHVPKAKARELYEDVTPPPTAEELEMRRLLSRAPQARRPRGTGRPEKRQRREIERLRGR
ncbi:MAG: S4 domain-containing protein [Acidobacteriota bacterium]